MNHSGRDWEPVYPICGLHVGVGRFFIPPGLTVKLQPYDGNMGGGKGRLSVQALSIYIAGIIDGSGADFRGGAPGIQGESGLGVGLPLATANGAGGGAGRTPASCSGSGGGHMESGLPSADGYAAGGFASTTPLT